MSVAVYLATVLALAPAAEPTAAADPAAAESSTKIATIILVTGPLPYREMDDALRIRLPRLRTLPYEPRSFDDVEGQSYAYVEITEPSAPRGAIDIAVILTDGRSYGRRFVPDESDPVRDTATMLANTIAAIEEERLQPVRDDAEIPLPPAEEPPDDPIDAPHPDDPQDAAPDKPRWSIGLTPGFGAVLGLAPKPTGVFGGGSVALDLSARAPIGAVVALGTRVTTQSSFGVRVTRIRILVAAGWAYRYRAFELLALAGFTIEPWLLSTGSGQRPSVSQADPIGPMFGGMGRVSPGVFLEPKRTPNFAVRLGLFAELAGSAIPGYGAPQLVLDDGSAGDDLITRLGGLELGTGLDATFWFAVPRRR